MPLSLTSIGRSSSDKAVFQQGRPKYADVTTRGLVQKAGLVETLDFVNPKSRHIKLVLLLSLQGQQTKDLTKPAF